MSYESTAADEGVVGGRRGFGRGDLFENDGLAGLVGFLEESGGFGLSGKRARLGLHFGLF